MNSSEHAGVTWDQVQAVRACTQDLISGLSPEDCNLQPEPDVSPAKWHLAHTTWFFETFVLLPYLRGYRVRDPRYAFCFNSYYESCGERHPRALRHLLSRPTLAEVLDWRASVDEGLAELLSGSVSAEVCERVTWGVHHEQQHQELLVMDVLASLFAQPLRPAWRTDALAASGEVASDGWVELPGGVVEVGASGGGFCFDNEAPRHPVLLRPFALGRRLVTNEAWEAFVDDGGYQNPSLWLSDGWAWVQREGIAHPCYWVRDGEGGFGQFTVRGLGPLEPDAPVVHVSGYEAEAFATWAGARLPTEAELEVGIAAAPNEGEGAFLEDGAWMPRPARAGGGLRQRLGDAWTWTRSAYRPYPGYRPPSGALGEYNGKFMSGQWVLRGAGCATPRSHARVSYRNFFYPHQRWMFAGVRLAREVPA